MAPLTPFSTAGMNPVGMTPPLIAFTNSKPLPGSSGSISMWQSPNWPRPPVCFLWRPWALACLRIVCLEGNGWGLEVDLAAKTRSQPFDDHLNVALRETRHDLLAGLLIAVQVDRRVLLLQAPQRSEDLVLIALALGLDRECHHWSRELDAGHLDRLVTAGQPVSGSGLLELGHRTDVAGTKLLRMPGLTAFEGHQLADALLVVGAGVEHVGVLGEYALVDAEQVDPPRERVGPGLEHVGEQLLVLDRIERKLPSRQAAMLDR